MRNSILNPFSEYIEESLSLMKEIVIELKEIKEILKIHQSWHIGDGK